MGVETPGLTSVEPIGVIAHYNLLEALPTDGPGELFRARDTIRGRTVIIRRLAPVTPTTLRHAIQTSAQALSALSHPNVIRLFDVGDDEARVLRHGAGIGDARGIFSGFRGVLQRVLRRDEPPHPVELQPLQRVERHHVVAAMGGIEGPAKEADPLAIAEGRRADHGLIWPLPRTWYLKVVSCSRPTGPRAWSLPVAMPISAPKPNSPPSANWVEALCSTIALSTSARKRSAAALSAVTIASVWCEP